MKYFETLLEDQETTISVLYAEQIIRIYSSEPKTIQKLTKTVGQPTTKYKKSKTYWSGASWDVSFFDLDKLKDVIYRDTFIDKKLKPIVKKEKKKPEKTKKEKLVKTTEKLVEKTKKKSGSIKEIKKEKVKGKKTNFEQIEFNFFNA